MLDQNQALRPISSGWRISSPTGPQKHVGMLTIGKYRSLAMTHNALGWDNILEGRTPIMNLDSHRQYIAERGTFYSVRAWSKGLIECLVHITHKEWLFQNSDLTYKKVDGPSPS